MARWYDVLAGERVYAVGRDVAISALRLGSGDRVLDVGCGTGLNFGRLLDSVGPMGRVVGVDRSPAMLGVARRKFPELDRVVLIHADATQLPRDRLIEAAAPATAYDAVLFTYSLSLMPQWPIAWRQATALLRDGGRVAVVDMQLPVGRARLAAPAARIACALGGSDPTARPWELLEREASDVESWSLRGGHIQVRVGIRSPP